MSSPFGFLSGFKNPDDERRLWDPIYQEIQRVIDESLAQGSLPEEKVILERLQAVVPSEEEVSRPENLLLATAHLVGVNNDVPQPDILGNTLRANAYLVRRIIENRLNLIELEERSLHLPEDANLNGATICAFILAAEGEKKAVKIGKYGYEKAVIGSKSFSEGIFQAMQLIAQMNIPDNEKERVLSACLPRIQKNEAGVQFYFPDGRFMFGISNRGGVIARSVSRKQNQWASYYELMAASYAIEHSDELDKEEKGRIQAAFFKVEEGKDGDYSIRLFNNNDLNLTYKTKENKLEYYFWTGRDNSGTPPLERDLRRLLSPYLPIGEFKPAARMSTGRDSDYTTYDPSVAEEDRMLVEFDRLGHIASIGGNGRGNEVPIGGLLHNLAFARKNHDPFHAGVNHLHSLLNAIELEVVPAEAEETKGEKPGDLPDELVVNYIQNPQDEAVLLEVIRMIEDRFHRKSYMGSRLANVSTVYEIFLDHPKTNYEMLRARIFDQDEYDEIKTRCVEVIRVRFPEEYESLVEDLFKAYEAGDMKTALLLIDWKNEANVQRLIQLVQSDFSCPDAIDTLYAVGTEEAIDVIFKVGLSTPKLRRKSAERVADLSEKQKGLSIEHEILVANALATEQASEDEAKKNLIKALRGALTREATIALYEQGSIAAYEALTVRHEKETWFRLRDGAESDHERPGFSKTLFSTHHTGVYVGGGGRTLDAPQDYGQRAAHLAAISGAGYKLATWAVSVHDWVGRAYTDSGYRKNFDREKLRDRVHEFGLEVMEEEYTGYYYSRSDIWTEQEQRVKDLWGELDKADDNQSKQRFAKAILIILKGCRRAYQQDTMDRLNHLANKPKSHGRNY